jgi:predicted molibdopterin-dependent oxidoreductase YjgC
MEERESFCLFCSLGCKFAVKVDKGVALSPEFCPDYPINEGRLCPKGLYAIELLNHPRRLLAPRIKEDGKIKEISWEESLGTLASKISEVKGKYGSQAIGIVIGPNHTNEEILAAQELARAIGTDNFACSFPPNDWGLLSTPDIIPPTRVEDMENANCSLIIGNLFVTHPVLARGVIDAKYKARGNSIMVIDPERTNTAWFANTHLQNRPGTEALTLVGMLKSILSSSPERGENIKKKLQAVPDEAISKATGLSMSQIAMVARAFNDAEKGGVFLSPGFKGMADINLIAQLCKLLVENAKGDKSFMPLFTFGNAVGAFSMCSRDGGKSFPQLIEEASSGKIKLLIDFGEDLLSSYPSAKVQGALSQLEFLTISSPFVFETERLAHMVLPCASWLEKNGTVNFFDARRERLEPVLEPPGIAKSDLEIILQLSREFGASLDAEKISKEAEALGRKSLSRGKGKPEMDKLAEKLNELVKESVAEDKEYPYLLIAGESTVHFTDGSITRNLDWAKEESPYPFIKLSVEDARGMGIKDGAEVLVSSRSGEIALPVQVTDRLQAGVASVPSYLAEIRSIFEWKITSEGELETSPERIRILKK